MRTSQDREAELRKQDASVRRAYDQVPYESASLHQTHPDHLSVLGSLLGMQPAPAQQCRVLELGAADGSNLLPMAFNLPQASFLGVDLSPRQIEAGKQRVKAWGVNNLELRTASVLDLGAELGHFDYIVAHGLFSWVPPAVQEKVLALCAQLLAPQGIAFISYNTYPGWHGREMLRRAMVDHAANATEPLQKVSRAFEVVDQLVAGTASSRDPHAQFLRSFREHLEPYRDRPSYVLHEYLAEHNQPLYFRELVQRAGDHGLQYLAEADPDEMEISNLPAEAVAAVQALAGEDRVQREHAMDLVKNRSFRRTLLCRAEIALQLQPRVQPLRAMHAASPVQAEQPRAPVADDSSMAFRTPGGRRFSTSHPVAKAALLELSSLAPEVLPVDELALRVRARLGQASETVDSVATAEATSHDRPTNDDVAAVGDFLWWAYFAGVVDLHASPLTCVRKVGPRPVASELARRQVLEGQLVTNQHHRTLRMDDAAALLLLRYLDGSRDRGALLRVLNREVSSGRLRLSAEVRKSGKPRRQVLGEMVDSHLRRLAEAALLVG